MKRVSFILLTFCVLSLTSYSANARHFKVVLQGGQSNSDGRAVLTSLPQTPVDLQQPQRDVIFYHDHTGADVAANQWTYLAPRQRYLRHLVIPTALARKCYSAEHSQMPVQMTALLLSNMHKVVPNWLRTGSLSSGPGVYRV